MPRKIFVLLALAAIVSGLFEDNDETVEMMPSDQEEYIKDPDYPVLSIVYDSTGQRSLQLSRVLKFMTPKLSNYMKFLIFDCFSYPDECSKDYLPDLPSISLYVPMGPNPYSGKPIVNQFSYQGAITEKDLGDFMLPKIPYLGDYIDKNYLPTFLELEGNKTILFTNKETAPLVMKGISLKFRGRINIGVVFENETQIIEKYEIKSFPTLIVIKDNEVIRFKGRQEFGDISDFLAKHTSSEKQVVRLSKKPKSQMNPIKLPAYNVLTLTSKNFEESVLRHSDIMLISFYNEKNVPEWDGITKRYNGIVIMGAFDCKGKEEHEYCAGLGVKRYPSLRLFPANKARKSWELHPEDSVAIESEIAKELKFDIKPLSENGISSFLSTVNSLQQQVCLLLTDGSIPLAFKSVASDPGLKSFTRFVYLKTTRSVASQYFNIGRFPNVVVLSNVNPKETMQTIEYGNDISDYSNLYYFVDQLALPSFLNTKLEILDEDLEHIEEIHDSSDFTQKCVKKPVSCLVAFLDISHPDIQSQYKALQYTQSVANVRKLPVSVVFIDSLCHKEAGKAFGIKESRYPGMVMYNGHSKSTEMFKGKFDEFHVLEFVEFSVRGRNQKSSIKEVAIEEKDCKDFWKGKNVDKKFLEGKKKKQKRIFKQNDEEL